METRRAIEICLSRLPMSKIAASELVRHLFLQSEVDTNELDNDAIRATIMEIIDLLEIDMSFSKFSMICRANDARKVARRLL